MFIIYQEIIVKMDKVGATLRERNQIKSHSVSNRRAAPVFALFLLELHRDRLRLLDRLVLLFFPKKDDAASLSSIII